MEGTIKATINHRASMKQPAQHAAVIISPMTHSGTRAFSDASVRRKRADESFTGVDVQSGLSAAEFLIGLAVLAAQCGQIAVGFAQGSRIDITVAVAVGSAEHLGFASLGTIAER